MDGRRIMERRDFLKTPVLGLLLPGTVSIDGLAGLAEPGADGQARKFQQKPHQDFETYIPGIEYFIIGNGDIMGVVQYCPDRTLERPPTFLGLTIMDAEHFARKSSTFLFHPEDGFGRSMLMVNVDGKGYSAEPEAFGTVEWKYPETVPVISARWNAGSCLVEEEVFAPAEGALLFRRVTVTNKGTAECHVSLWQRLCPNFVMFDEIVAEEKSRTVVGKGFATIRLVCPDEPVRVAGRYDMILDPFPLKAGDSRQVTYVYSLRGDEKQIVSRGIDAIWKETAAYWKSKPMVSSGNGMLDHLFAVARTGLKSQTARSGKRDSGLWMYNMEWVRDDVMVAMSMLPLGFVEEARTILFKVLEKSIGVDGRTIESSRWSGFDYAELDQNGQLLYGLWTYLCWTGDLALVRSYWKTIRSVGEFLLLDVFRDTKARLLRNKREFWERGDSFGVEDGFEIAYQFWAALGLERGADMAAKVDDAETVRLWREAGGEIRRIMLEDPTYRLIEEGHFIKRRTRDGRWQKHMIPFDRKKMPPGSPMATLDKPACEPDTASVYPIMYEFVDPKADIAKKTLEGMEVLWNQKWGHGGYARYNTDSEPDIPGPWPFASLFLARAYAEAGNSAKVWRILKWLNDIHGGKSGGWFERYGPSITPPAPPVCYVGWNSAEIPMLVVHHLMGFRPEIDRVVIRPKLLDDLNELKGRFTVRGSEFDVVIRRTGVPGAVVDGAAHPFKQGTLVLGYPAKPSPVRVEITV
jgi:hypothetical protein